MYPSKDNFEDKVYPLYRGKTFEDSRKIDKLFDEMAIQMKEVNLKDLSDLFFMNNQGLYEIESDIVTEQKEGYDLKLVSIGKQFPDYSGEIYVLNENLKINGEMQNIAYIDKDNRLRLNVYPPEDEREKVIEIRKKKEVLSNLMKKDLEENQEYCFNPQTEEYTLKVQKIEDGKLKDIEHITDSVDFKRGYEAELVLDFKNMELKQNLKYNGFVVDTNYVIKYGSYHGMLIASPYFLDDDHRDVLLSGYINKQIQKAKNQEENKSRDLTQENKEQKDKDYWIVEFNESSKLIERDYVGKRLSEELLDEIRDIDEKICIHNMTLGEDEYGSATNEWLGYSKFYFDHVIDGEVVEHFRLDVGDGNVTNSAEFEYLYEQIGANEKEYNEKIEKIIEENHEFKSLNERQLEQVRRGLKEEIDVNIYGNENFSWQQMHEIRSGLKQGINVNVYADPEYTWEEMNQIKLGLKNGLDTSVYDSKNKYNWQQMHEIREGLESEIDVSKYTNPKYNSMQMFEIREGLEIGLDVSSYANPENSLEVMQLRKSYLQNLKDCKESYFNYVRSKFGEEAYENISSQKDLNVVGLSAIKEEINGKMLQADLLYNFSEQSEILRIREVKDDVVQDEVLKTFTNNKLAKEMRFLLDSFALDENLTINSERIKDYIESNFNEYNEYKNILEKETPQINNEEIIDVEEEELEQVVKEPEEVIQEQKNEEIKEERKEDINEKEEEKESIDKTSLADYEVIQKEESLTPSQRLERNIEAISILNKLEREEREATNEEKEALKKYVGWGGLAEVFDANSQGQWLEARNFLKRNLSEQEYEKAQESTLTSFYTPNFVIANMYKALNNIGFKGGDVLEPSCGTGRFLYNAPNNLKEKMNITGVELDSVSGKIAKYLNPSTDIVVGGFEDFKVTNNKYDLVIGNVPFGNFVVYDEEYNKDKLNIHDYFFNKSLDKAKEDGVVAFITSSGTLDKQDSSFREKISEKANFLGAVRLPNSVFKGEAGTDTLTDIIFLQKKTPEMENANNFSFLNLKKDENGLTYNEYFVDNPEMVVGNLYSKSGRYGREVLACNIEETKDVNKELEKALSNIKGDFSLVRDSEIEKEDESNKNNIIELENIDIDSIKPFSYFNVDGDLYFKGAREVEELNGLSFREQELIKGYIEFRDALRTVVNLQVQDADERDIVSARNEMNHIYDNFFEEYEGFSLKKYERYFRRDSDYFLVCSSEILNDDDKVVGKSAIFTKRTIKKAEVVESVDNPRDAMIVSMSEKGKLDLDYMSSISGMKKEELVAELRDEMFVDTSDPRIIKLYKEIE